MKAEAVTAIIEMHGAKITEDGTGVFIPDADLGNLAPVCRITSLENAPTEIACYAHCFSFDTAWLETAWDIPYEQWSPSMWERCEQTGADLQVAWKDLALFLLLCERILPEGNGCGGAG